MSDDEFEPAPSPNRPTPTWILRLDQFALALSFAIVLARTTTLEAVRDPFDANPGVLLGPRGPSAATMLLLNVLCAVPALLVLFRRVADRTFTLRRSLGNVLMIGLAVLAGVSFLWASDKFAAVVMGSTWAAALVLAWSISQLVRTWKRVRLAAGVAVGLLLLLVVQSVIHRAVDLPEMQRAFQANRQQELESRGMKVGSFAAMRFEQKVMAGEMQGFSASPNTFAAVLVVCCAISIGVLAQRVADRDEPLWAVAIAIIVASAIWALTYTGTRAVLGSVTAGIVLFAVLRFAHEWVSQRSARLFALAITGAVVVILLIVLQGVRSGHLFEDSLTFRWRYWVGAWRMAMHHPLLGVGFDNFPDAYLQYRLPIAAEEIRDPHNLFMRMLSELGLVGLGLTVGWVLFHAWRLTQCRALLHHDEAPRRPKLHFRTLTPSVGTALWGPTMIATFGMLLNGVTSVDVHQDPWFVLGEVMTRMLMVCALLGGMVIASVQSSTDARPDDRPAPWVRYGFIVSLALMLLHAMIDFALFETGGMFIFALALGSALGATDEARIVEKTTQSRALPALTLVSASCVAIVFVSQAVVPISWAEWVAHRGDELLTAMDPKNAAATYRKAFNIVPYNSDYAYRWARASNAAAADPAEFRAAIDAGINADPRPVKLQLLKSRYEWARQPPDRERMLGGYKEALARSPMDVLTRLEYAEALKRFNEFAEAAQQLEQALWYDDQLPPAEMERLSPQRVSELREQVRDLRRRK